MLVYLNTELIHYDKIKSNNQINFIPIMGPRGANRNYTYSKITHINSQEGKRPVCQIQNKVNLKNLFILVVMSPHFVGVKPIINFFKLKVFY
jgi:hypothetical protein